MKMVLSVLFWTFFVLTSLLFCAIGLLIRIVTFPLDPNRRALQQFSAFWASLYIWVNPLWSIEKISGLEKVDRRKVYVIVANHQSMIDILVLYRSFLHFKWVSKREMFKVPLIGWNMWLNGYVGIKRGDERSRERCLEECRAWIKRGSSILFFPEGTRSKDGSLGPFKPGAFRLAIEMGVPILPIVIRGTREALPKHSLRLETRARMSLEVLPEIPISSSEDPKLLGDRVREVMRERLDSL